MNSRISSLFLMPPLALAVASLTVGAAYLLPDKLMFIPAIPLGCFLILLTWHSPRAVALAVVALIPLGTFAELSQSMSRLTLFKVLFPLPFLALVAGVAVGRFRLPRVALLDRCVFWWIVVNVFLIFSSLDKGEALTFCRRLGSLALFYFMLTRLLHEPGHFRTLIRVIIFSTLLSVMVGFAVYLSGNTAFFSRENLRVTGASGMGPGSYTASLFLPIWLSVSEAVMSRERWRRALFWGLAVVIAAIIPLTLSRSGAMIFALTIFSGLLLWRKKLTPVHYGLLLGVIMLGLVLVPQSFWERASRLTEMTDTNISDYSLWRRMNYLDVGRNIMKAHPFLGAGPGNFPKLHADARYQKEISLIGVERLPHNMYVQIVTETGIVGGIFFAGVLLAAMFTALGGLGPESHRDAAARALIITWVGILAMGIFSHIMLTKYFWLILACIRIMGERKVGV